MKKFVMLVLVSAVVAVVMGMVTCLPMKAAVPGEFVFPQVVSVTPYGGTYDQDKVAWSISLELLNLRQDYHVSAYLNDHCVVDAVVQAGIGYDNRWIWNGNVYTPGHTAHAVEYRLDVKVYLWDGIGNGSLQLHDAHTKSHPLVNSYVWFNYATKNHYNHPQYGPYDEVYINYGYQGGYHLGLYWIVVKLNGLEIDSYDAETGWNLDRDASILMNLDTHSWGYDLTITMYEQNEEGDGPDLDHIVSELSEHFGDHGGGGGGG